MVGIIAIMLLQELTAYSGVMPGADMPMIYSIIMWVTAGVTLISGATYIIQNRDCISEQ